MLYDVTIIGGGISGLALALDLRLRGFKILVIEKGLYPRHKVCGEYISNESKQYLQKLCPALLNYSLPFINQFRLTTSQNEFITDLASGGFGISRFLLENLLYKEAISKGVEFLIKTKVRSVSRVKERFELMIDNEIIKSKLVCDCSGRNSNLTKQNNFLNNYVGVKYHVKTRRHPSLIEIHNFKGGYCGISNIEDNLSCLCYIVNSEYLKQAGNSIKNLEEKFLFQNKHLKKTFNSSEFIFKEPVTTSGIYFRMKFPVFNGILYAGDSAGSIAPVTGNGMSIGLRSAFILSEQVNRYLDGIISQQEMHNAYSAEWKKQFARRIKLSTWLQKLSEYPFLTSASVRLFNTFPSVAQKLISKTHGSPF